jgi:hypothetical protein
MTDQELLERATQFEFSNDVKVVKSPLGYPHRPWYVKRGVDFILDREKGWRIYNQVGDGGFLFKSAREAVEFLLEGKWQER